MNTEPLTLSGDFVRLVPLAPEHIGALAELARDEEVWRHLATSLGTLDEVSAWSERAFADQAAGTAVPFAILERATGRPIGSTRFFDIQHAHRGLEIGHTWLARSVWRTRVNSECKFLLLRRAFEELGCIRVQLKTDKKNERSRRAILRLGAREEGILRQNMVVRGGVLRDTVIFSILDTEWPAVKEKLARGLYGEAQAPKVMLGRA